MTGFEAYLSIIQNSRWNVFVEKLDGMSFYPNESDDYVWDLVKKNFKYWKSEFPIFIFASTGTGKNYSFEELVIQNPNAKFLYLSNRIALNLQEKKALLKRLELENMISLYTDEGLKQLEEFKNVTILTYHRFEKLNLTHQYDYIVADEVHGLYVEADYNSKTEKILQKILSFQNSIRIYQTATPFDIFPIIYQYEFQVFSQKLNTTLFNRQFTPFFYVMEKSNNYQLKYFREFQDLDSTIKKSKEKFLIFVDSISLGNELKTKYETFDKEVDFINSRNKMDSPEYKNIIKDEKFECDILIATKVLNVGINLKMKNLKNIVICEFDRDEVLQMIGRARNFNSETGTIFCKLMNQKNINQAIFNIEKSLECIYRLRRTQDIDALIRSDNLDEVLRFSYVEKGKIIVNPFAIERLKKKKMMLELLRKKGEDLTYASGLAYSVWLNNYQKVHEITADDILYDNSKEIEAIKCIENFLKDYVDKSLDSELQAIFRAKFSELYQSVFEIVPNSKHEVYGKNIINNILKEKKLSYKIKTVEKSWILINTKEFNTKGE